MSDILKQLYRLNSPIFRFFGGSQSSPAFPQPMIWSLKSYDRLRRPTPDCPSNPRLSKRGQTLQSQCIDRHLHSTTRRKAGKGSAELQSMFLSKILQPTFHQHPSLPATGTLADVALPLLDISSSRTTRTGFIFLNSSVPVNSFEHKARPPIRPCRSPCTVPATVERGRILQTKIAKDFIDRISAESVLRVC